MTRWSLLWLGLLLLLVVLDLAAVYEGAYGSQFAMHVWHLTGPVLSLRWLRVLALWLLLSVHLFTGRINTCSRSGY